MSRVLVKLEVRRDVYEYIKGLVVAAGQPDRVMIGQEAVSLDEVALVPDDTQEAKRRRQ